MTARKGHNEAETPETEPTAEVTGDTGTALPDLANATHAGQLAGIAAAQAAADIAAAQATDVGEPVDVSDALGNLKALGNANPDVNVTAVLNSHGTWTWTARANDDGRELAKGGPHYADRIVENLQLLFSGSTVALHATGVEKARRLA